MKIFYCNNHATHWPVGGASIVIAENEDRARILLQGALHQDGIKNWASPFTLHEIIDDGIEMAIILANGEY